MKIKNNKRKRLVWHLLWIAAFAFIVIALVQVGILPSPYSTSMKTLTKICDLGGNDYEITYTNSDTLAKNEVISVYVMKTSEGLGKWFRKKTLIFQYDPALSIDPPLITDVDSHTIRISIRRVSSVFYERHNWERFSIDYQIGRVDYP